jgi:hypothetical protein
MENENRNAAPGQEDAAAQEDVELFASYTVEEINERRELFTPGATFWYSSNQGSS